MIYSKKLSEFKEIVHGFTTREDGDFRLKNLGQINTAVLNCLKTKKLVLMKQEHTDKIKIVRSANLKKEMTVFEGFDGLVTPQNNFVLGVRTADCCPILFYEPVAKIVGAAHAGWRGTSMEISKKMVEEIKSLGGQAENLIAVIGPHIGMCCHDINKERAILFEEKFGKDILLISGIEKKPHLDLAYVNFKQLIQAGLKKENIEVPLFCTSCQKDLFFSFRRSRRENDEYGEMLSFIGFI